MAVRDQLVNPVLRCLGWNPENPEAVQPNVSTDEGVPDYCLIKKRKTLLFVEAKKLGVDIEKPGPLGQLAKYCFGEGTEYGVLTNGALWILIKSFEAGTKVAERIMWRADLENEELAKVSQKLATISRDTIEQIEPSVMKAMKAQSLDEIWQSLLDQPKHIVEGLIPVVRSLADEGYPSYPFEQEEIADFLREKVNEIVPGVPLEITAEEPVEPAPEPGGQHMPRRMTLEDETVELEHYFEILVNVANWLIKKGKLKRADCPVATERARRRNLVNVEPKHRDGERFHQPKQLSDALWIEAHASGEALENYARWLLERFGCSRDTLVLEY